MRGSGDSDDGSVAGASVPAGWREGLVLQVRRGRPWCGGRGAKGLLQKPWTYVCTCVAGRARKGSVRALHSGTRALLPTGGNTAPSATATTPHPLFPRPAPIPPFTAVPRRPPPLTHPPCRCLWATAAAAQDAEVQEIRDVLLVLIIAAEHYSLQHDGGEYTRLLTFCKRVCKYFQKCSDTSERVHGGGGADDVVRRRARAAHSVFPLQRGQDVLLLRTRCECSPFAHPACLSN